jgi:hypothetical protein
VIHNYLWPHHSYLQTDLLSCRVEASWTLDGDSGEKRFVSKWFLRNISLPINCTPPRYRDYRYFEVRITASMTYPEIIRRVALIEVEHARVLFSQTAP